MHPRSVRDDNSNNPAGHAVERYTVVTHASLPCYTQATSIAVAFWYCSHATWPEGHTPRLAITTPPLYYRLSAVLLPPLTPLELFQRAYLALFVSPSAPACSPRFTRI